MVTGNGTAIELSASECREIAGGGIDLELAKAVFSYSFDAAYDFGYNVVGPWLYCKLNG